MTMVGTELYCKWRREQPLVNKMKDCGEELRQSRVLINRYVVAEGLAEGAAKAHVQATPFRFEEGL